MPENPDLFPADWTKPGGPRHQWEAVRCNDPELPMEECINGCGIRRFQSYNNHKWRYFRVGIPVWTYKRPRCIHPGCAAMTGSEKP
jgi:hypothetical protein